MKKYINKSKLAILGGIFTAGLVTTSCDKGFVELNTNPNAVTTPVLENMFTYNIVKTGGTGYENHRGNLIYAGAMIQHFASLNTYWSGDKYLSNVEYYSAYFETAYANQVKEIEQIISLTKDDAALSNKYNISRIWRAFIYHRITDLYGDIPYSEAGKGFLDGTLAPKYDTQQFIYTDMLKELDEAAAALDASKESYGAADVLYSGDVAKWKKFAYSLMLRLGMRVTKADAAMAQSYVKKAIAGGVMTSNDDVARLLHYNTNDNNWLQEGNLLKTQEYDATNLKGKGNSKLSKTFVDFLQTNNDPRLPYIATLWEGNADPNALPASSAPAVQKGLPNGYDPTTIKTLIPSWNDASLATYSEANLNYIASNAAPTVFQSYAEVEYLLAEAALRGWGDGAIAAHYNKGVTAAMKLFSLYGATITDAEISAYLAAHPFPATGEAAEMNAIHTQYWAATFLNSYEAYANWRRTGYPVLTPTNYAGNATGGVIPRRLRYPASEGSKNAVNYKAAVAIQGLDDFLTRGWWDK
ncbi:SusD/RagB family nutrient-binding outer membrane lipoprotein [Dyadobacter subterraneus]|uniref:SusD/RagB family nutrient-binding outer membrane lipoprotein n=1 Tax=Dyadobacter subterraneus TaxID=2773304 RepID=A0ABR9W6I6_9BACT|nr:SusD/RagB family nutrient-binding outer membrane lipoprotein [Dyadobacter subterraneus]MBE9461082.1 SusD/RagB family nutrient-binding outer membrane lipoprotein [Dyadobacter subterraneus]